MAYDAMAEDVLALLNRNEWRDCHLLGHSMGGKIAMVLALREPSRIASLIVGDIAPIAYAYDFKDYVEAMRSVDLKGLNNRQDADHALEESIPDSSVRAFLLQNLVSSSDGYCWRANLDVLSNSMSSISDFPKIAERRFENRALFVRGERSDYMKDAYRDVVRSFFPNAQFVTIADAGHWVHAEKLEEFTRVIGDFLRS